MKNEKRLIDADALLLEIEEELEHKSPFFTTLQNEMIDCGLRIAAKDIRHMPTVDAVEVVRCKDCVWWRGRKCKNAFGMVSFNENNFCSYGEKEATCQRNRQK